jgi:hypothetical protein
MGEACSAFIPPMGQKRESLLGCFTSVLPFEIGHLR